MVQWVVSIASALCLALAGAWLARRASLHARNAAWDDALGRLNAYCQRFADAHALRCIAGTDGSPCGWPRLSGEIEGSSFSLTFGWRQRDDWIAIMRLRHPVRSAGELHAVSSHLVGETPTRGRAAHTGDVEFDDAFRVWVQGAVDVQRMLPPRARGALAGIPLAELAHRDGVTMLNWPCREYTDGSATTDEDYMAIEFGFDAVTVIHRGSRALEETM